MCKNEFRYQLKLAKRAELKFLSHLDWQNLILKSLRRSNVHFALTEGFNKVPKISFSPALPLFIESGCELVNFITLKPLSDSFLEDFKLSAPQSLEIVSIKELEVTERRLESLDTLIQWALYEAKIPAGNLVNKSLGISNFDDFIYTIEKCLSSSDFFIEKKTKKGIIKQINYRNSIKSARVAGDRFEFVLKTGQDSALPALRADVFLKYLLSDSAIFEIRRSAFYDKDMAPI